jgi:hypothetical protein
MMLIYFLVHSHGMSYAISGLVKSYKASDYDTGYPIIVCIVKLPDILLFGVLFLLTILF